MQTIYLLVISCYGRLIATSYTSASDRDTLGLTELLKVLEEEWGKLHPLPDDPQEAWAVLDSQGLGSYLSWARLDTELISSMPFPIPGFPLPLQGTPKREEIPGAVIFHCYVNGFRLAIQLCPSGAWNHWDTHATISSGPVLDNKFHLPMGNLEEDGWVFPLPTLLQKQTLENWCNGEGRPYGLEPGDDILKWGALEEAKCPTLN